MQLLVVLDFRLVLVCLDLEVDSWSCVSAGVRWNAALLACTTELKCKFSFFFYNCPLGYRLYGIPHN